MQGQSQESWLILTLNNSLLWCGSQTSIRRSWREERQKTLSTLGNNLNASKMSEDKKQTAEFWCISLKKNHSKIRVHLQPLQIFTPKYSIIGFPSLPTNCGLIYCRTPPLFCLVHKNFSELVASLCSACHSGDTGERDPEFTVSQRFRFRFTQHLMRSDWTDTHTEGCVGFTALCTLLCRAKALREVCLWSVPHLLPGLYLALQNMIPAVDSMMPVTTVQSV